MRFHRRCAEGIKSGRRAHPVFGRKFLSAAVNCDKSSSRPQRRLSFFGEKSFSESFTKYQGVVVILLIQLRLDMP